MPPTATFYTYPGWGENAYTQSNMSQAVRVGNTIKLSGQGGWDPTTSVIPTNRAQEIDQAFANVDYTVKQAGGAGMDQVYKLVVYLAPWDEEAVDKVSENMKRWFPEHAPILSVFGVVRLYGTMTIEIEAEAVVG